MIIIGEKINTSIKAIEEAVINRNEEIIKDIAVKQVEAGANYLDVNCGTFIQDEGEMISWLIDLIRGVTNIPLCIDSPNPQAVKAALEKLGSDENTIINSITAEKERWEKITPFVKEYGTSVVALCMNDNGIPDSSEERLKIAFLIADRLAMKGIGFDRIYFDPMVNPVSTDSNSGLLTLETIRKIKKEIPEAHITCGLSNISFGLPVRKLLNQAFLVASIFSGLDTAIINPLDKNLMALIYASEALAGNDEYCMEYISKYRAGIIK